MKRETKQASPFKERLLKFMETIGVGQTKFEEDAGLSRGSINKIVDSMKDPSINKIKARFPELDINWLKTGQGTMLESKEVAKSANNTEMVIALILDEIAGIKANIKNSLYSDEKDELMKRIERLDNL